MVSQPASTSNIQRESTRTLRILLLLLLDAGVVLALLIFIVWWTWPRSGKRDDEL